MNRIESSKRSVIYDNWPCLIGTFGRSIFFSNLLLINQISRITRPLRRPECLPSLSFFYPSIILLSFLVFYYSIRKFYYNASLLQRLQRCKLMQTRSRFRIKFSSWLLDSLYWLNFNTLYRIIPRFLSKKNHYFLLLHTRARVLWNDSYALKKLLFPNKNIYIYIFFFFLFIYIYIYI